MKGTTALTLLAERRYLEETQVEKSVVNAQADVQVRLGCCIWGLAQYLLIGYQSPIYGAPSEMRDGDTTATITKVCAILGG